MPIPEGRNKSENGTARNRRSWHGRAASREREREKRKGKEGKTARELIAASIEQMRETRRKRRIGRVSRSKNEGKARKRGEAAEKRRREENGKKQTQCKEGGQEVSRRHTTWRGNEVWTVGRAREEESSIAVASGARGE